MDKDKLSQRVLDFVRCLGACAAGIATTETLAGGPPSADLTYVLPGAKSAISFALPLDQNLIRPFLGKKDRVSHERDNYRVNGLAGGLSLQLSKWLDQQGYPSLAQASNDVYRRDTPGGVLAMHPELSLRYLAVRSGVGHFGLSGNVITKDHGAGVILGCAVTTAELNPTDPLPENGNYCDKCRLCLASCASGLVEPKEMTTVELGGVEFEYSKRRSYLRCEYVCGGFTGLHSSGKWSTWSPGRFPIPEDDAEFGPALATSLSSYVNRPKMEGGFYHSLSPKSNGIRPSVVPVMNMAYQSRRHPMGDISSLATHARSGLAAMISLLIFKEDVTVLRWIGIVVICVGVFLVSRS